MACFDDIHGVYDLSRTEFIQSEYTESLAHKAVKILNEHEISNGRQPIYEYRLVPEDLLHLLQRSYI
jgi:hypothetical protein